MPLYPEHVDFKWRKQGRDKRSREEFSCCICFWFLDSNIYDSILLACSLSSVLCVEQRRIEEESRSIDRDFSEKIDMRVINDISTGSD